MFLTACGALSPTVRIRTDVSCALMRKAPLPLDEDIKEINSTDLSYESIKSINDLIVFAKKNNEVIDTICNQ